MRICFLADAGSINTRTWVDYFAERLGHEVHVVSLHRRGELSPSVTLHLVGGERSRIRQVDKLGYLSASREVRRILRRIAPDLVVGYRVASYGYLAARSGFRPLAVAAQSELIVPRGGGAFKRACVQRALSSADLVNSWAPHMTERLIALGAPPDRILTCPRGIDLEAFAPGVPATDRSDTVASTRALTPRYRTDVLIRAIALVRDEVSGVSAVVAGDGEAASELRVLCDRLGVGDRVEFIGSRPNRDLPRYLREAAVYASAIQTDGVSASLLEAMACGCFPVVADNAANADWIRHGLNGFLVSAPDSELYARAIAAALGDAELRAAASRENRRIVEERADLVTNMKVIEESYLRLVGGSRPVQ